MKLLHWIAPVGLVLLGMVLGAAVLGSARADTSRDGYSNTVLEITAAGSELNVRNAPRQNAAALDVLYWGDRVLWTGESASADGYNWLKVAISDGRTGWIVDVSGWTITMDPVYTTPGMGLGALTRVTTEGSGSHCRAEASASSTEFRTMKTNDQATVIAGPYQSEYWIWWQYRLSSGYECWIVDVPGWFEVTQSGTF